MRSYNLSCCIFSFVGKHTILHGYLTLWFDKKDQYLEMINQFFTFPCFEFRISWGHTYKHTHIYTGCPRRKGRNFGRAFLMLKYTDITQNTYIQSWTVTEIMAREKCGLLAGLRTVPCQLTAYRKSVLDCRARLQNYRWHSYVSTPLWLTACHVYCLEPLRTTMTWVRVFL